MKIYFMVSPFNKAATSKRRRAATITQNLIRHIYTCKCFKLNLINDYMNIFVEPFLKH